MNNNFQVITSKSFGNFSPLRYPGGKAILSGLFADLIKHLRIEKPTYVEPYGGGAGAGIALLCQGIIDKLVINDIDSAVYAFWHTLINNPNALLDFIRNVPLTIDEWKKQREIYRACDESNLLDLGLAFFYLNRTNRSGILTGGVIGGIHQNGNYKIDARFNRETLSKRIIDITSVADSITITNLDGRDVLSNYKENTNTLIYIDPPYVSAGNSLYLNAFDYYDHEKLAEEVKQIQAAHWIVTYDNHPLIEDLYHDLYLCCLEITYSASKPGKARELLAASPKIAQYISSAPQFFQQVTPETDTLVSTLLQHL